MRPTTIIVRVSLAALLGAAPVLVLAGPAAAAAPVSVDDTGYTVAEDGTLVGTSVLDNDADADGDLLTAVLDSGPTDGILSLDATGTFVYTPDADFNGTDSFTYRAIGATEMGNAATVTITVSPVRDLPTANPDTYAIPGDSPLVVAAPGVLGNDTNPDGLPLNVGAYSNPSYGSFVINFDGSFDYTPLPGFRGIDTFLYAAEDGAGGWSVSQVTIAVGNVPPVADPDSHDLDEDTTLTATSVLANDTDVNGDPLTAILVSGPSNGTLTFAADGTFTYTPVANFNGVDSFAYQASDGTAQSAPTTVTLNVAPIIDQARFDPTILALSAVEDAPYVGQTTAINTDGRPLVYSAATTGTPTGSVVMDPASGAFTFTPEPDFAGLAQLDVYACDSFYYCASQLINITVVNTPDAPVADDQTVPASQGGPVSGTFAVRDIDSPVLTFRVTSAPQRGAVVIDADMWTFVFTPAAGTSGLDSFVVEICDPDGLCDSSTVTVDVVATPPAVAPAVRAPAVAAPVVTAAAGASGEGALAVTGADVSALALGALAMVGIGGVVVARGARRRTAA